MMITWKHDISDTPWPPVFEEKVDIFYHRLLGWQLHVADLVANGGNWLENSEGNRPVLEIPHSGFAVLQICMSYFETIGQYQKIKHNTTKDGDFFREGVCAVFPNLLQESESVVKDFLDALYKNTRCGLYHMSMTRMRVALSSLQPNTPMQFDPVKKFLLIDPHILPKSLKAHLEGYRRQLLDTSNTRLRSNFEAQFDKDNGLNTLP